jgi:hypothetical protein
MVVRTTTDEADGIALQLDLRCNASRVRGVGLKSGVRYWAQGVHQSHRRPGECLTCFDLVGRFELRGAAVDGPQPGRMALIVRLHGTVASDGRVTVAVEEVELLPESGS